MAGFLSLFLLLVGAILTGYGYLSTSTALADWLPFQATMGGVRLLLFYSATFFLAYQCWKKFDYLVSRGLAGFILHPSARPHYLPPAEEPITAEIVG